MFSDPTNTISNDLSLVPMMSGRTAVTSTGTSVTMMTMWMMWTRTRTRVWISSASMRATSANFSSIISVRATRRASFTRFVFLSLIRTWFMLFRTHIAWGRTWTTRIRPGLTRIRSYRWQRLSRFICQFLLQSLQYRSHLFMKIPSNTNASLNSLINGFLSLLI